MKRWFETIVLVAMLFLPRTGAGEEAGGHGLVELEEMATSRFAEVQAAEARVRRLEAELSEVRWQPLSGVRVRGLLAPTPERRGDALHSAQGDISFSGSMGVLVRAEVTASFPIYTFGRLTAERRAAQSAVEAGRERVEAAKARTRLRVHQAYWSLVLAEESESLLDEGRRYVGRARDYIEAQLETERSSVTESDRLRVEVLESEVDARLADARRAKHLADRALRLLTGLDTKVPIERAPLEPLTTALRPLSFHLETARGSRPEVEAQRAQVRAATLQVKAARARYLPEVRLVGQFGYSYSNVVDDQHTPFANDSFNYLRYGAGLEVRWDIDVLTDHAKVRQAVARHEEEQALERQAVAETEREVEEAYAEVEEGQQVVEARRRGRRAARGWLVAVMQGIDVGVLEPEDLVDGLKAYFEQSFLYLQAVSELNTAVARLEVASGLASAEGESHE